MEELSVNLGLNEFVSFTGRVSDQLMLDILNSCDICVNPDIYNEMNDKSTMNKIMEYMALGKPIVQYNLKEGKVSAEGASLYAKNNNINDFADKIFELMNDQDKRDIMSKIGKERIYNELHWEIEKKKYIKTYENLFI